MPLGALVFCGLTKNGSFVGFKICGHHIFLHNSYRKLLVLRHRNLWIGPSMKKNENWLDVIERRIQRYFSYIAMGKLAKFPDLDLLPGTQHHGQLGGLKHAKLTPTQALCCQKTSFTSLPSEGPHMRVCRESNPDHPIRSPACYIYITAAGKTKIGTSSKLSHSQYLLLNCATFAKIHHCLTIRIY